jgi:Laminin G domain
VIPAVRRLLGAASVLTASAVTMLGAACGPPPVGPAWTTASNTIGSWPMDEAGGAIMRDQSGSGLHGAIGSAVVAGGGTYRFPGWSQNVDPSGRLVGTVPSDAGAVTVADPSDLLDGTGSFAVTLRLRSDLTAQGRLPSASGASYNIVQKARADDPGGFWKLELAGSGTTSGRLRWVLSDGQRSAVVMSAARVDDGQWHTVTAERRGGQSALTVDGVTSTTSAARVGEIHPHGTYSAAMTVGKKPGSIDPRDAFAGWLDALTVQG